MSGCCETQIGQPVRSPRILSLDGGGIRGLSSLIILEEIMRQVSKARNMKNIMRPCDYFHLIGGTSTGGIIAIMLGRLEMTVDACIKAYKRVAAQAFTPKYGKILPASPRGAFSAKSLESVMKQIIRENCVENECREQRSQGSLTGLPCPHDEMPFYKSSLTKTVVIAITKENVNAPPTLLRSYDDTQSFQFCPIWQVARATSAATTFFKSICLGRDEIEFIDAGFGYNNPCELLIAEAERLFPAEENRKNMQILSIGTGIGDVVAIKDRRMSIIKALKKMATSSSKVEAALSDRYGDGGRYHRFAVSEGLGNVALSDWQLASQISAHTHNYLRSQEKRIKHYVVGIPSDGSSGDSIKSEERERTALDKTAADRPDIDPEIVQNTSDSRFPGRPWIRQGGSVFCSTIRGKDVRQGNRVDISPHPARYCSLDQEGSNFGGEIYSEQKVEQGNYIKV
ncbi:acyl transferase/acyl hydrolase/lysophospholipase [Xylaria arbuscula]|nr:acyl transferase/acyl hydrolase/lysophospholipase [Xylaria arbuscula]